jgi:hypothetical protein
LALFFETGIQLSRLRCYLLKNKSDAPGAWIAPCGIINTMHRRYFMNRHLMHGIAVGGIFAGMITWIAAADAVTEGGLALLASLVFGLAAGVCIGGLVAANFAMLAAEEKKPREVTAAHSVPAHAHA